MSYVIIFQGLKETEHPFTFVARQGFREMLETQGANEKATPLVPRLVQPIRAALVSPIYLFLL